MVDVFTLTLGFWHPPLTKAWDNKTLEEKKDRQTDRDRKKERETIALKKRNVHTSAFLKQAWHRYRHWSLPANQVKEQQ